MQWEAFDAIYDIAVYHGTSRTRHPIDIGRMIWMKSEVEAQVENEAVSFSSAEGENQRARRLVYMYVTLNIYTGSTVLKFSHRQMRVRDQQQQAWAGIWCATGLYQLTRIRDINTKTRGAKRGAIRGPTMQEWGITNRFEGLDAIVFPFI
jgi:hypothetical protein